GPIATPGIAEHTSIARGNKGASLERAKNQRNSCCSPPAPRRGSRHGAWSERYDRLTVFLPNADSPLAAQVKLPIKGKFALVNTPDYPDRTAVPAKTRCSHHAWVLRIS